MASPNSLGSIDSCITLDIPNIDDILIRRGMKRRRGMQWPEKTHSLDSYTTFDSGDRKDDDDELLAKIVNPSSDPEAARAIKTRVFILLGHPGAGEFSGYRLRHLPTAGGHTKYVCTKTGKTLR
ncbi:hypothetical protein BOTBODRAFT_26330 [Botryobasidium botryosum FD-172 SS1]|uniref:Uncharacterized protein n=1 Tax=Botryobasidium botryosum (strain FD-172 SS1) TaxID=930990 RepID=A0A067NDT2_BOTB1|nr:hypothetical protein BOTBODRAFT_26330 [Botryobasidium botryosum FD-172 SS1]